MEDERAPEANALPPEGEETRDCRPESREEKEVVVLADSEPSLPAQKVPPRENEDTTLVPVVITEENAAEGSQEASGPDSRAACAVEGESSEVEEGPRGQDSTVTAAASEVDQAEEEHEATSRLVVGGASPPNGEESAGELLVRGETDSAEPAEVHRADIVGSEAPAATSGDPGQTHGAAQEDGVPHGEVPPGEQDLREADLNPEEIFSQETFEAVLSEPLPKELHEGGVSGSSAMEDIPGPAQDSCDAEEEPSSEALDERTEYLEVSAEDVTVAESDLPDSDTEVQGAGTQAEATREVGAESSAGGPEPIEVLDVEVVEDQSPSAAEPAGDYDDTWCDLPVEVVAQDAQESVTADRTVPEDDESAQQAPLVCEEESPAESEAQEAEGEAEQPATAPTPGVSFLPFGALTEALEAVDLVEPLELEELEGSEGRPESAEVLPEVASAGEEVCAVTEEPAQVKPCEEHAEARQAEQEITEQEITEEQEAAGPPIKEQVAEQPVEAFAEQQTSVPEETEHVEASHPADHGAQAADLTEEISPQEEYQIEEAAAGGHTGEEAAPEGLAGERDAVGEATSPAAEGPEPQEVHHEGVAPAESEETVQVPLSGEETGGEDTLSTERTWTIEQEDSQPEAAPEGEYEELEPVEEASGEVESEEDWLQPELPAEEYQAPRRSRRFLPVGVGLAAAVVLAGILLWPEIRSSLSGGDVASALRSSQRGQSGVKKGSSAEGRQARTTEAKVTKTPPSALGAKGLVASEGKGTAGSVAPGEGTPGRAGKEGGRAVSEGAPPKAGAGTSRGEVQRIERRYLAAWNRALQLALNGPGAPDGNR